MNIQKEIELDHGTGAKLSQDLIHFITEILGDSHIGKMEDSAVLPIQGDKIALTTDSFVVTPHFFGNGDIGKIAVCGTVNDVAVSGAKPLYLTLAMILEVGFKTDDLRIIIESIRDVAREAGVKIAAGDTKVVNKGEVDKIFINTTGIGVFDHAPLSTAYVKPDDEIILSGLIGNHSIHLLSIREGLGFERNVLSDCAPLNNVIDQLLLKFKDDIHSIRDVTRGGLGEVLQEYAKTSGYTLRFQESHLPIQTETAMAADMLGINPLHLANEGCMCLFVAPDKAQDVVSFLREFEYGKHATTIGTVTQKREAKVLMVSEDQQESVLEELIGAELPRLC